MVNPAHRNYSYRAHDGRRRPMYDPYEAPSSSIEPSEATNRWRWFTDILHSWVVSYGVPATVPPIVDSWERTLAGMVRHVHTELDNAYTGIKEFQFWRRNADETLTHVAGQIDYLLSELRKVKKEAEEAKQDATATKQELAHTREELAMVRNQLMEALEPIGEEDPEEEPMEDGFDAQGAALDAALIEEEEEEEPEELPEESEDEGSVISTDDD